MEVEKRAMEGQAVTVSGVHPETEDGLIGQQQWQDIHERQARGETISSIAQELDLDRKTVRACLRQSCWKPYRRRAGVAGMLDAHRQWLHERAPQVHYSARILYQELCRQRSWAGSYETVKLAVRPLRAAASLDALTQCRFETNPGEQAQVDWGQATVPLDGIPTAVHVFVMTLGYSRRGYAEGFLHERLPNLLSAHEHAFAHFGGVCHTLLYDRMRTVALGTTADVDGRRKIQLNATFEAFAAHWGFAPRLCRPYRAKTKGKVESGVKYVKRNFVPGRTFADLDDFNAQLAAWLAEVSDVRIHGTTHQRPIDRFVEEAKALIPTASQPSFLQAMTRERVVATDWLVSIDNNRYSVPFRLIGRTVQVVREGGRWLIRHQGQIVAEHPVLAGHGGLSILPEHGPGAALRNARQRYAERPPLDRAPEREVEIRDLLIYEQLLEQPVIPREVA